MPETPIGIVYPDSTGHTRLWEHFEAMADSIDPLISAVPRFLYGQLTIASLPGGGSWTDNAATITFDPPFSTQPRVFLQNVSRYGGTDPVLIAVASVSGSGASISAKCASSKGQQIYYWFAIGV